MADPAGRKRITIYDLAMLAEASPSTVSAVLSGNWRKRRISERMAQRIQELARQHGYALNMQARALRKERSGIIGMIVPMYDNRYFSSIAQTFEQMARARGLLPIVTSTQRDPALEAEAASAMLAYQVETLICTGTTDPDQIHDLCAAAGVPTLNLDLPGTKAASVISDNYAGALTLTRQALATAKGEGQFIFLGGRATDHNTRERIRGFLDAHTEQGLSVDPANILTGGYAADKAYEALSHHLASTGRLPPGLFVASTITLEGVVRFFGDHPDLNMTELSIACFDWDPFVAVLGKNIFMVRQDVTAMMRHIFDLVDGRAEAPTLIEVPLVPMEFDDDAPT
ncbi:LacI family DNA-binding transcriptional regulator [Aestuariibius insulae]|uniref:LacI family DNA-binding transcriptional regulator n=1 Tax=Aestuariibius insulae TaxID=2058287 RepID=UPI00345E9943